MTVQANNIHVIINPVAGRTPPAYDAIGDALANSEARTTIHLTKADYTGTDCARDALEQGADLIIAYGGDGTMMEVANVIHGHDVPMGMLPGGTANVVAHELNIPQNTQQALALIMEGNHHLKAMDAGKVGDTYFLLRTSIGWEAELSQRPSREDKTSWGTLAYTRAALEALRDMSPVTYCITLDGDTEHTIEGINCSICNIGNVGLYGVNIGLDIAPDDGLLNVLVLQNDSVQAMVDITQNVLAGSLPLEIEERLAHYKAKKITVTSDEPQRMSQDGEPFEATFPLTFECVPEFIKIITPQISQSE